MKNLKNRIAFFVLLLLFLLSASLTGYLYQRYQDASTERSAESFELARVSAIQVASRVNEELALVKSLGDKLAQDVSSGALPPYQLARRVRTSMESHPVVLGMGMAYERGKYLSRRELYAPFFVRRNDDSIVQFQVEDSYDYTDPTITESSWYFDSLKKDSGFWTEPFLSTILDDQWMVEYRVPVYRETANGRETLGLVYTTLAIDAIVEFLNSIDAGEEGFTYLVSDQGNYIVHPRHDFARRSIFDKAAELEAIDPENNGLQADNLRAIGQRILNGERFHVDSVDPATGQDVWTFHRPILLNGWSIGVVFDKFIGQERPHIFVRDLIFLALSLILTITLLMSLIFRVHQGQLWSLWGISAVYGVLTLLCIAFIWYLEATYPPRDTSQIVLVNQTVLADQLETIDHAFSENLEDPPVRVPTGVIIETISFVGGDNAITGYIWQKYPLDLPEDVQKGFRFTDIVDGAIGHVEEIYRVVEKGHELIGWSFRTTLRQEPSVDKYPLDEATVQMQIWPKSLDNRVILIPDLDSYEFMMPSQTPGLVDVLVLENWKKVRSYFSYRYDIYNANFGSDRSIVRNYTPDLYFNVILNRVLLSPLIAYGVTVLIVLSLMFAILIIRVGSSFEVLGYAASLFFVIAVSQVGLRGELDASGVVYLEYGYILLYVIILIVSVNSILYYSETPLWFIRYRDNLIPKLLYWPIAASMMLGITVATFLPTPQLIPSPPVSVPSQTASQQTSTRNNNNDSADPVADSTAPADTEIASTEALPDEVTGTGTDAVTTTVALTSPEALEGVAPTSPLTFTALITDPLAVINETISDSLNATGTVSGTAPIIVGLLNSETGSMAVSEVPVRNALLLAIAEINQAGGVMGQRIIPVLEDGASDWPTFADKARKLLTEDEAAVVFGGWTSASRKEMLPVFEELNGLLFYPVQYEGLESSPNIFYFGAEPTQQILPAIDYLLAREYANIYLIGSDYVFPRTANAIVKAQLEAAGASVAGEWYIPLGGDDFSDVLKDIVTNKPDAIFNTLNGDSNIAFFSLLNTIGYTSKDLPVMSVSIAEPEINTIGRENMAGHFTAWNYFQTLESPENARFVAAYKTAYGEDVVTSDPVEAAYTSVYLWKNMVEAAGSTDVDIIRQTIQTRTVEYQAPSGLISVDTQSQHMYKTARIGVVREDGLVDEVWHSDGPVAPDPFLQAYEWAEGLADEILGELAAQEAAQEEDIYADILRIAIADYIPGLTDVWLNEEILPLFKEEYPDFTVEVETIFWGDLEEQVSMYIAEGVGPDIINMTPQMMQAYQTNLTPLDTAFNDWDGLSSLITTTLTDMIWDDALHGLPWRTMPLATFCRTDLLQEVGIDTAPTTFAEMIAMSGPATKIRNNALAQQAFMAEEQLDNTLEFLTLLHTVGGFSDDRSGPPMPILDSPASEAVLNYMYARRRAILPADAIGPLPDKTDSRLATGEAVCYWGQLGDAPPLDATNLWGTISLSPSVIQDDNPESHPLVPIRIRSLVVPTYTTHLEQATAFLRILGEAEALNTYNASFGSVPPRQDAWFGFMEDPVMQELGDLMIAYGHSFGDVRSLRTFQTILKTEMDAYFTDQQDVQTTMTNMQKRYDQVLLDSMTHE
ncbi:MAG: urea ABC transporter substrate-binding protein [Chloroflexota bacterium]